MMKVTSRNYQSFSLLNSSHTHAKNAHRFIHVKAN